MNKNEIERDGEYDWIKLAKNRKYIKQPKPQLDELAIYNSFHKKVRREPVESQPKPFSHHFVPRKFKEKIRLNRTFDDRGEVHFPYEDGDSDGSLELDHYKKRKKIMLDV